MIYKCFIPVTGVALWIFQGALTLILYLVQYHSSIGRWSGKQLSPHLTDEKADSSRVDMICLRAHVWQPGSDRSGMTIPILPSPNCVDILTVS